VLDSDDQRRLIDEAISSLDFSRSRRSAGVSVAHRTYARALFEAAKDRDARQVREELATSSRARRRCPELDALLENPQLDPRAKARRSTTCSRRRRAVRNFLRSREKNRGGQIARSSASSSASCAEERA
jgi:F0F1-type ATP synthase delta subunit